MSAGPVDWRQLPLAGDGRSLVEASAGTGKTWTIAALYLRLLLEERRSPRQIIVSTFTNAAAAELGERLRGRIMWALAEAAAHAGGEGLEPADDEASDRAWLRERWRRDPASSCLRDDVLRLQAALAELDSAPISTLHSLCSRILADHPFAAGAPFRARELVDDKALATEIVTDLQRILSQGDADDELVRLATAAKFEAGKLEGFKDILLAPDVVIGPFVPPDAFERIDEAVGGIDAWIADAREIRTAEGLVNRTTNLPKAWFELADAFETRDADVLARLWKRLDALSAATGMKGVNKKGKTHPAVLRLVEASERLAAVFSLPELDMAGDSERRRFLAAARRWSLRAMQERLDAAGQSTFDQLLHATRTALSPADGSRALADALHAAWPVALVDEFQDTDPTQFAILDAIYRDADGAPRGRLVMIGDPKQAIYRFRGGDVQAYARAKAQVAERDRLTLVTNHRSSRGYVEAINQFHALTGRKLEPAGSDTGIEYEDGEASARRDAEPLRRAGEDAAIARPLVLHEIDPEFSGGDLEQEALRACAGEIAHALSADGYRIGNKPLEPGDVAVLLPNHVQIAAMARLLKARGIPCVAVSRSNVFQSDIARDLRVVLHAVLHPGEAPAIRAALATPLWGGSLGRLQALVEDSIAWNAEVSIFHELHLRLEQSGPLAVVQALMERHAARLLDSVAGERMLTDLRHLAELLQAAWEECGGGERLSAWFGQQMAGGSDDEESADARALRLESDAARVKLMTLHASKGLEFGVVHLPLMWKSGAGPGKSFGLLGDGGSSRVVVLGGAKACVRRQEHEERFRLLYVALTRAIHACHVYVLPAEGCRVIEDARKPGEVPINNRDLEKIRTAPSAEASRIELRMGWERHAGVLWRASGQDGKRREVRALPPEPVGPLPMRHSFSTLSGGARRSSASEDNAADDEAFAEEVAVTAFEAAEPMIAPPAETAPVDDSPAWHPDLDALAMVAGTDFGNAVHAVFEHRIVGAPLDEAQVRAELGHHGVRPREGGIDELAGPLHRRLQGVLDFPLDGESGPRLGALAASDMRAELEFNYALEDVSLGALRRACEAHGEHDIVPAREQQLAGLMNGKIDLVFAHDGRYHVLDYKGNQLSSGRPDLRDYAPVALEGKMRATGYRLQALLYTVAVERHLRERLGSTYRRDVHLGDCWYLFIRAVGLRLPDGTACGVWRHRFGDALLDAVQSALGSRMEEAA